MVLFLCLLNRFVTAGNLMWSRLFYYSCINRTRMMMGTHVCGIHIEQKQNIMRQTESDKWMTFFHRNQRMEDVWLEEMRPLMHLGWLKSLHFLFETLRHTLIRQDKQKKHAKMQETRNLMHLNVTRACRAFFLLYFTNKQVQHTFLLLPFISNTQINKDDTNCTLCRLIKIKKRECFLIIVSSSSSSNHHRMYRNGH